MSDETAGTTGASTNVGAIEGATGAVAAGATGATAPAPDRLAQWKSEIHAKIDDLEKAFGVNARFASGPISRLRQLLDVLR
jgi:hypothetical protein